MDEQHPRDQERDADRPRSRKGRLELDRRDCIVTLGGRDHAARPGGEHAQVGRGDAAASSSHRAVSGARPRRGRDPPARARRARRSSRADDRDAAPRPGSTDRLRRARNPVRRATDRADDDRRARDLREARLPRRVAAGDARRREPMSLLAAPTNRGDLSQPARRHGRNGIPASRWASSSDCRGEVLPRRGLPGAGGPRRSSATPRRGTGRRRPRPQLRPRRAARSPPRDGSTSSGPART